MVKFTLYHANWCRHCRNFIPTWNQLRNDSSLNDVEFEDFEQTASPEVMKQNNIRGYPTLVIDKVNHEGRRDYDTLRSKLKNLLKKSKNNKLKENNEDNEKADIVNEKLEETDNDNAELMFGGSKRKTKRKLKKRKVNRKPVSSKKKKRKKTKETKETKKTKKRNIKRKPRRNKNKKVKKRKSKK